MKNSNYVIQKESYPRAVALIEHAAKGINKTLDILPVNILFYRIGINIIQRLSLFLV